MNHEFQVKYKKAQLALLREVEGKYRPSAQDKLAVGVLGAVEATTAFILLFPSGILVASIAAVLPLALILIAGAYHSDCYELPKTFEAMIEEYENATDE